jgi:hypothetical protein
MLKMVSEKSCLAKDHVPTPIESGRPESYPALLVSRNETQQHQFTTPNGVCVDSPDHLAMVEKCLPPDLL